MCQRYIKKRLIKNYKYKRYTNSIAKECNKLKNAKHQDLAEKCSLPIIFLQQRVIFHHILMNKYLKKIHVLNSMKIKGTKIIHMVLKTLSNKIYSVKFFLIKRKKIVRYKLMLLAVLKWDRVAYYQAKISLIFE